MATPIYTGAGVLRTMTCTYGKIHLDSKTASHAVYFCCNCRKSKFSTVSASPLKVNGYIFRRSKFAIFTLLPFPIGINS